MPNKVIVPKNLNITFFPFPSLSLWTKVDLEEERIKNEAASLTLRRKVLLYSSRILLSLVAFGLIIAAFYGIYEATTFSQVGDGWFYLRLFVIHISSYLWLIIWWSASFCTCYLWQRKVKETGVLGLFYEYLPSIVITVGNFVVPVLCDQIALLERYNPSITVIVALLRFVRVVHLTVVYVCRYVRLYACVPVCLWLCMCLCMWVCMREQ